MFFFIIICINFFFIVSRFVQIMYKGKYESITKSRLCTILQNDTIKISSDIKQRFLFKKTSIELKNLDKRGNVWKDNEITRGDWIVAVSKNGKLVAGMILNFQKCEAKTKKERLYYHDIVDMTDRNLENVSFLLQPIYYLIDKKFSPTLISYLNIKNYVCHIQNHDIDLNLYYEDIENYYHFFLEN